MKNALTRFLALFALLFVFASVAHAQDAAPANSFTPDGVVQWLTPILVPLILAGVKRIAPSIPGSLIPLAAPILGVMLDFANHLATGHSSNWVAGVGLGLLGVAVREVKEAVKPATNGGWPAPTP